MTGESKEEKKYMVRFRYIPPYDYNTPFLHIPIEGTIVRANSPEQAWEQFLADRDETPREWYRKEEVYEQ